MPTDSRPADPGFTSGNDLTPEVLRSAYGRFPSGVAAVCAVVDGKPTGISASSFVSVSLNPALVSVCVALTSTTWPTLKRAGTLGVSVLADAHAPVAKALASRGTDKFAAVQWVRDESDAVFINGSALWLNCAIYEQVRVGDHDIVVLEVNGVRADTAVSPLVFHDSNFHRVAAPDAWATN
ncbi:flavin reductase family protein [Nocardia sp. CA2R105]|uniref:flavin reductase family protein n=1 Tax=Nocardia coffeae TaxID=2873381 RepID=UPI001CA646B7|nr:flavin reductase family protein [Nocardia coffeae]MBY8862268.1 flavin reductase family protein [Nocardia coffeae]